MFLAWDDAADYLLPSSPNHRPLAVIVANDTPNMTRTKKNRKRQTEYLEKLKQ